MSMFAVIPQGSVESKRRKQLSLSSCGWVLIRSGQLKITLLECDPIEDTFVHCCPSWKIVEVSTPLSATVEKEGDRSDRPEVNLELATKHRAAVARVVYLA